jgi:hypothetical protein
LYYSSGTLIKGSKETGFAMRKEVYFLREISFYKWE